MNKCLTKPMRSWIIGALFPVLAPMIGMAQHFDKAHGNILTAFECPSRTRGVKLKTEMLAGAVDDRGMRPFYRDHMIECAGPFTVTRYRIENPKKYADYRAKNREEMVIREARLMAAKETQQPLNPDSLWKYSPSALALVYLYHQIKATGILVGGLFDSRVEHAMEYHRAKQEAIENPIVTVGQGGKGYSSILP
ncbi:MAG: hypothetical protein HY401_00840 [Elusimicrobia bacterium]|nr:hypothetical protein [Elusimicrobiota bacterium]